MIDSEPVHYQAFTKALARYNVKLTRADYNAHYIGLSDMDCAEKMKRRYSLPVQVNQLYQQKIDAYNSLFSKAIHPRPGLLALINNLYKGNFVLGIASSSRLSEIFETLQVLSLNTYFKVVCSTQEVSHGKPAPDIYILAAKKLNAKYSECLVLEDSPKGVASALAAHILCLAIPSNETRNANFEHATQVLSSLSRVFDWIKQYNKSMSSQALL